MATDDAVQDAWLAYYGRLTAMPKWPRTCRAVLRLPSVALDDVRDLPKASGLYFAVADAARIVYVGSTVNLRQRWMVGHHHLADFRVMGSVRVAYLCVHGVSILSRAEDAAIFQFWPELNYQTRTLRRHGIGGTGYQALPRPQWPTIQWLRWLLRRYPHCLT